jgi:hypothetical protein
MLAGAGEAGEGVRAGSRGDYVIPVGKGLHAIAQMTDVQLIMLPVSAPCYLEFLACTVHSGLSGHLCALSFGMD